MFNASTIKDILLLLRYETNEAVGLHKNPTASKCMFVVNKIEIFLFLKVSCFLHCLPILKQYTYYNILNSIKELFIVLICNYPTSVFAVSFAFNHTQIRKALHVFLYLSYRQSYLFGYFFTSNIRALWYATINLSLCLYELFSELIFV